ncbi:MAG: hypothetical protein KAQ67_04450, partial [Gammaproteobacteria bacterium]|nr:hypothetical protein [Gammaproteobacteria bacterium]
NLSSDVLNLVTAAAPAAQAGLQQAQDDLQAAQTALDNAELDLNNASAQLTADLAAAQQKVLDAAADVQTALQELNTVIAQIDTLNNAYQGLLSDAQIAVNNAQKAVNDAYNLAIYYNNKIISLYNWYQKLSAYNKLKYAVYYSSKRAQYIALRTAAWATHTIAKATLAAAQLALDVLNSELADLLNPFEISRIVLQTAYNTADGILTTAQQELAAIEASIVADLTLKPLYEALDLARATLTTAQNLVAELSGIIAMAEYLASQGAEAAFNLETANLTIDLATLISSSSVDIDARVTFLGQQGQITLSLDLANPVNSFHQVVTDLQTGKLFLSNNDVTPPTVIANQPAEWSRNQTLIQLIAEDNQTGTGIASISYSATGAQTIAKVTIAGKETFALINVEGLTSLSFYATDISGNVSETTTISISIDNIGPEISVTPSGINAGVYEVTINARDLLGSGIDYIAVSASGAEHITESIELADEVIINLAVEGTTILTITAVDVAGNTTTMTHDVIVPKLFTDNGDPITASSAVPAEDTSGSGGSFGLLWMLLASMMFSLRRVQMHTKLHQ